MDTLERLKSEYSTLKSIQSTVEDEFKILEDKISALIHELEGSSEMKKESAHSNEILRKLK